MIDKKYGKFSLGVPSGMSFGALRGLATDEVDALGEPEAPDDGTGIPPNEHELRVRATPAAQADRNTRRNANLFSQSRDEERLDGTKSFLSLRE